MYVMCKHFVAIMKCEYSEGGTALYTIIIIIIIIIFIDLTNTN